LAQLIIFGQQHAWLYRSPNPKVDGL